MYYQKSKSPTFLPLGLYMPGGNRKTMDPVHKLPGRTEKNGVIRVIEHNDPSIYTRFLRIKKSHI